MLMQEYIGKCYYAGALCKEWFQTMLPLGHLYTMLGVMPEKERA